MSATIVGLSGSSCSCTTRGSRTKRRSRSTASCVGQILANEEVKDGHYIETGDPVERRLMKQWMFRITEYAERLLEDLEGLDWPEGIKQMKREWIGKSVGA